MSVIGKGGARPVVPQKPVVPVAPPVKSDATPATQPPATAPIPGKTSTYAGGGTAQATAALQQARPLNAGIGAGGTVALLGGFRDLKLPSANRALESARTPADLGNLVGAASTPATSSPSAGRVDASALLAANTPEAAKAAASRLPPDAITVSGIDAPVDVKGLRKLDPAMTAAVVNRTIQAAGERLAGVRSDAPDFSDRMARACMDRNEAAAKTRTRDPDVATVVRLATGRANDAFEGYVDAGGRVVLAEKDHAIKPSVQAQIDPARGTAAVQKMLVGTHDPAIAKAVVGDLANKVPAGILEALAKDGVSLEFSTRDGLYADGNNARSMLGDRTARAIRGESSGEARAHYNTLFGDVRVSAEPDDTRASVATFARHELMHAVDHAMAPRGSSWRSEQPEFKAIFDRTEAARARGDKNPAFPTGYAGTNPQEFFAESAAMYLGTHVNNRGSADMVHTREHLKTSNPEVYAYMERLFEKDAPAALKNGEWRGRERFGESARAFAESVESTPENKRSSDDWYALAAMKTAEGVFQQSPTLLAEANVAADMSRKKNTALFGLVKKPSPEVDELQARIAQHLQSLGS